MNEVGQSRVDRSASGPMPIPAHAACQTPPGCYFRQAR